MICPNASCGKHVRKSDIEDTVFRMVAGQIIGDINCFHCGKVTRVIQIVDYVPVNFDKKRKGDI